MTKAFVIGLGVIFGLTLSTASPASRASGRAVEEQHDRTGQVTGVITAIEGSKVTITPSSGPAVSGRLVPGKTVITVNGRSGRVSEVQIAVYATGVLGFDDVWSSINVTHKR